MAPDSDLKQSYCIYTSRVRLLILSAIGLIAITIAFGFYIWGTTTSVDLITVILSSVSGVAIIESLIRVICKSKRIPRLRTNEINRPVPSQTLIAVLIYIVITIIFFYPVLSDITTALIGPTEDNVKYLWNMWWGERYFAGLEPSLTYSSDIFYPEGSSLVFNDFSWYNLGISLLLSPVFNNTTIYNILILHTFVIAALGAFLLVRYMTGSFWAGILGGFIFAFNPSHFAHSLHHLNIASIQFLPFFTLYNIKSVRMGGMRNSILAAFFLFLCAMCDWNYLIFCLLLMAIIYAFVAIRQKRIILPDIVRNSAIILGFGLLPVFPWLIKMSIVGLANPQANPAGHNLFVADALAFIIPHSHHLLSGVDFIDGFNRMITGNPWESAVYLGIANIALAVYALFMGSRRVFILIVSLITFSILAMGSYLHFAGIQLPIALPYKLIEMTPLLKHARNPARLIVFVYLVLAILSPLGLIYLCKRWKLRSKRAIVFAVFSTVIFFDFFSVCTETSNTSSPLCYEVIEQDNGDYAILDLPTSWTGNAQYMMFQTFHHRPIVQGLVPRKIGRSLIDYLSFRDIQERRRQLISNKVKYIVLHKELLGAAAADAIHYHKRVFTQIYSDARQVVFQVY